MNELGKAAQAVLDRWDSPAWEWVAHGPTAALMADLREALAAHRQAEPVSALSRYNEIAADSETYTGHALERLRIFCSLAMTEEDWLDVEPFFDDAEQELAKLEQQAEPVGDDGPEYGIDEDTGRVK